MPNPLAAGDFVHDRYRVEKLLGQGAFGATYLARDEERFGESCALKELQPHDPKVVIKARELFEREARMLLAIDHPQIPALHAFFVEEGRYFLVQKLVEGQALDSVLQESGPLGESAVRRIVVEVLGVLDYLHRRERPVLHRDIKPSNLIRDRQGVIHVIDFGAVREAVGATTLANAATTIGTPGYAPLEQAVGHPVPASDLHALGMTALYLMTGRRPSEWVDPITAEPSVIGRTGASPEFEQFLARMVANLPARFQSAEQALKELLGGQTRIGAVDPSAVTTVDLDSTRVEAPPSKPAVPRQGIARAPRRWVAVGVVAVVSVLLVWNVVGGGEQDSPPVSSSSPPAAAESLDRQATLATPTGMELSVNHPATWQLISTGADGHIGLRDGRSNSVFVTGLEASTEPALSFARQWALRMSRKYGSIDLSDQGRYDQSGSFWRFQLRVNRSTNPEQGLLVIEEPPSSNGTTLFRWWALLGQTDATIPTALAMANSLAARASPER